MVGKTKEFIKKDRKVMDTRVSIATILSHATINFIYAFISGFLIAIIGTYNYLYIGITYLIFKRFEGIIFNRGGYESKFGNKILYPWPSTAGFLLGCYLSEILRKNNIL